jgi:uncharacterized membrane protein YhiD involved in acid resistance
MKSLNVAVIAIALATVAQVSFAAIEQSPFPRSADAQNSNTLLVQTQYFEQRETNIRKEMAPLLGSTSPHSADALYSKALPAQTRYFEQRAANIEKEMAPRLGSPFPRGAD